jgi:ABC-type nitrate/sulfonate/bicarbonate transport system substrate-binding protein
MLGDTGIDATNTTLVEGTSTDAVNQLKQGTIDAAFMVAAPSSTTVQGALAACRRARDVGEFWVHPLAISQFVRLIGESGQAMAGQ